MQIDAEEVAVALICVVKSIGTALEAANLLERATLGRILREVGEHEMEGRFAGDLLKMMGANLEKPWEPTPEDVRAGFRIVESDT